MRGLLKAIAVRTAVAIVAGVVVRACLIAAIGFALAAVYLWILIETDPVTAAIATAGVALAFALVVAAIAALVMRQRRRPAASGAPASNGAGEAQLAGASHWIADNPKTAALAALGAGIVLGVFPELRRDVLNAAASAMRRRSPPAPPRA